MRPKKHKTRFHAQKYTGTVEKQVLGLLGSKVASSAFPVVASLHPSGGAGEATTGNTSVSAG